MSDTTPPKKTVRFALDDKPTTPPTPKKTVRFALDEDIIEGPSTSSLEGPSTSSLEGPSTSSLAVANKPSLDSAVDASSATPNAAPTLSNASQTSSSGTNTHSTHSTLSPTEIRTWSEEVSSCVPLQESLSRETPTSAIAPPALHHSYSDDRGEKDAAGRVVEASNEPCEKCGGKVVWATRGEWLMICGECQEPQ